MEGRARSCCRSRPTRSIRYATGWTDDMFMASAVLSRVGERRVGGDRRQAADDLRRRSCSGRMGIFIHAVDGPHAWGRGNGFALLGLTEALTHLPAKLERSPARARDLSQARRGAREASIGRWQLAAGRRRADQLSRADGDGDDDRGDGARRSPWLDRSRDVRADHQSRLDRGRVARQRRRHRQGCVLGNRRRDRPRSTTSIVPS